MYTLSMKTLAAVFALSISQIAYAQQLDIVQILGQFIQTNYAVSRCSKPDSQTLSQFHQNFKIVSVRATEELKKRNPGKTEQEIVQRLKQSTSAVENAIDDAIRTHGCSDPRIQDLLKRFKMQAGLKL